MDKSKKAMRVALYVRVSTDDQTCANQISALHKHAERAGWQIVKIYDDDGVSGAKSREHRKQFDELLKAATRREFDMIAAWSVDRLGRSLQHLCEFLTEIHALGIDLYLHQQGLDTSTPAGRAMFQMMGVFSEFERAMISERVKASIARRRAEGKRVGRQPVSSDIEARIRELRATGMGIRKVARTVGVGTSVVQRVDAENKKTQAA